MLKESRKTLIRTPLTIPARKTADAANLEEEIRAVVSWCRELATDCEYAW